MASTDVEMIDAGALPSAPIETKVDPDSQYLDDLRQFLKMIEKAANNQDYTQMTRPVRALSHLRTRTTINGLMRIIYGLHCKSDDRQMYLKSLGDLSKNAAAVDVGANAKENAGAKSRQVIPEIDAYIHLIVLMFLIDQERVEQAVQSADLLMEKIKGQTRRTLDPIAAKFYYFYALVYEKASRLKEVKHVLHMRYRIATLRKDEEGQATLINAILRYHVKHHYYDGAEKFISRTTFPENVHNNQLARYHYYLGRVKAIQCEYSEAFQHLQQGVRKTPNHGALGFRQTMNKFYITVQLLLGDIPSRSVFLSKPLKESLFPYYLLTQAVRAGSLQKFTNVLNEYDAKFRSDETYPLIIRLRHNVIKTGLRTINAAYSRITIQDVQRKLLLDSVDSCKYILAKAITERAIEAELKPDEGVLISTSNANIYNTNEPYYAFNQRINFAMALHDQCVRSMRYPQTAGEEEARKAEERLEREKQEEELANEIADDDEDFEDDDFF